MLITTETPDANRRTTLLARIPEVLAEFERQIDPAGNLVPISRRLRDRHDTGDRAMTAQ